MINAVLKFFLSADFNNDRGVFYAALATVTTVSVLFFSLVIIPFQQSASQYTPSLLRYIKRDWRLISGFFGCLLLVLTEMVLCWSTPTPFTVAVAFGGVLVSFVLIGYLWNWSVTLLDPTSLIIPKVKQKSIATVNNMYAKLEKRKKTNQERIAELETIMSQVLFGNEKVEEKDSQKFEIPRSYLGPLLAEVSILKGLCIGFARSNQLEMFQSVWASLMQVVNYYIEKRNGYISHVDTFIIDFSDDCRDIIAASKQSNNFHFLRSIWKGIETLALSSLGNSVIGSKEGHHELCRPLLDVLKENVQQHIVTGNLDGAYESVRSLGNIGIAMVLRGYIQSAASVCNDLSITASLSNKLNMSAVDLLARQYLADIFYKSLILRVLFVNYDHPYSTMLKCYERIWKLPTHPMALLTNSDPMTWWDADLIKDRGISSIVMAGLFPNDENVLDYNLDVIEQFLELIKEYFLRSQNLRGFGNQFYQICIWLLAFADKEIALEFLLYRKSFVIPTEKQRETGLSILFSFLSWLVGLFLQSFDPSRPRTVSINRTELLNDVLSTYYMLLHYNEIHKLGLDAKIGENFKNYLEIAANNRTRIELESIEWENLRLFANYLHRKNLYKRQWRRLAALLDRRRPRTYSGSMSLHRLNFVQRPIITFNMQIFSELDKAIFGSTPSL